MGAGARALLNLDHFCPDHAERLKEDWQRSAFHLDPFATRVIDFPHFGEKDIRCLALAPRQLVP